MESSRIFVKGLPPTITEADLRKHFSRGQTTISDVKVIPYRRIGYIGFKSHEEAAQAVQYYNRSFIRLSKISVELARPIAAPSLAKAKLPQRAKPEEASLAASNDVSIHETKKRKRDTLHESDPKLREFLSVMQPAKRSATTLHEIERGPDAEKWSEMPDATTVNEMESEGELKSIPSSRVFKQSGPPMNSTGLAAPPNWARVYDATSKRKDPDGDDAAADDRVAELKDGPAVRTASATDDDWLRSRTNRLLDLVDPDDAMPDRANATPRRKESQEQPQLEAETDGALDIDVAHDVERKSADSVNTALETLRKTSRLYVRNLPYSATEDDVRSYLERYGELTEVHMPTHSSNNKGFAFVSYADADCAVAAFQSADKMTFQGRILHLLPSSAKRDLTLDEFSLSKLPLKQQNLIRKRAKAATEKFNWNSLYMSQDAVNSSVADRLGIAKSELLDPTSSDAAVKQAIAETCVIQDTKAYFAANGVDLDTFKTSQRGDTSILVKNLPYGTSVEELRSLFEEHGQVLRVLMPPAGTIAIVEFAQDARAAFAKLAYRRFKNSVLYLEKGPQKLFVTGGRQLCTAASIGAVTRQKVSASELKAGREDDDQEETCSLFVRNLSFATTTDQLAETFMGLDGFKSAQVKTKTDPKKPGKTLSMGFGFVAFRDKASAEAALAIMDGQILHGHRLQVRASHRGRDAAEEGKRGVKTKQGHRPQTKLIIKNLPFEVTKPDIRKLLGNYGQLRSVRIPKNMKSRSKGFGFAEFINAREAEVAKSSLEGVHLLGRRLVMEFAETESVDAEEEIARMQQKVGGQVNSVALQQLTGAGRKRFKVGEEVEDEDEG